MMRLHWRLIITLMLVAAPCANAQSAYQCYSADGKSSWLQNAPCAKQAAYANSLYKCVSPSGAVSIQQQPCTGNTKTAWRRSAVPEPAPTYEQQVSRARKRAQDEQDARELARRAGTDQQQSYIATNPFPDRRAIQQDQCRQAKWSRDEVLKQVGLARNFDLLRQLNDAVYRACQGL